MLDDLDSLYASRLAESGISDVAARYADLFPLPKNKTANLWRGAPMQPSIVIHYPTPAGRRNGFYRLRLLGTSPGFTFEKPRRYLQPPQSGVHAYLPRVKDVSWLELLTDPDAPLIITEGEFKALAATLSGFPTIGLGGVENWHSAREGVPLIAELDAVKWEGRNVYICYDSDVASKPQVALAAQRLASELAGRGAVVFDAGLPSSPGALKIGLDDFLVLQGKRALELHLAAALPFASVKALHEFNERFLYIRSAARVYEVSSRFQFNAFEFKNVTEANAFYTVQTVNSKGEPKLDKRSTPVEWLKWQNRRDVQCTDYVPGASELIVARPERGLVLNLWPGWGVQPQRGNIDPWTKLFDFLTSELPDNEIEAVRTWLMQWFAYPLHYPGAKLFSAVALWGSTPGTGKTLLGETMLKVYGQNGQFVEATDLEGSFNSWAKCKQFVLGDEITGTDSRNHADKLKGLITGTSLYINEKYEKPYNLPNTVQFYFTSNHPDAFFLDQDRRYLVIETPSKPLTSAFYSKYREWLYGDGPAAIFYHLLHNVNLDGFNPQGPAPGTFAKEIMIDQGKSEVGRFITAVMHDPDQAKKLYGVPVDIELFAPNELHKYFDPRGEKRATVKAISLELQKQGAVKIFGGRQIELTGAGHYRFYAVRNGDKWKLTKKTGKVRDYVNARELPIPKF